MIKGIFGSIFLLISTMFYLTRYICASIGVSKSSTWSTEEFNVFLKNVPNNLLILSIIFLLIGLLFIVCGVVDHLKNKDNN
ncbi:hypothetical protein CNQ87_16520 [Lysinibacillus fusiformis]|nr:hypothetical protein CNQ87_16520 [Lysinibacillus fusiformis]